MRLTPLSALVLTLCASALPLHAENWAQWRGPAFNGTSSETGLPSDWSVDKGVKWKCPLPGASGATPIIWENTVFVSSPDADKNLCLLSIDARTGKVNWQKTLVESGNMEKGRANGSSPSPVTDGKAVYVMYATGDLVAVDFTGKEIWRRNLGQDYGKLAFMWLYGSSPLLFEGKLYVQVLQRSPAPKDYPGIAGSEGERESYLLALDPANGKTIWKVARPTDARAESQESYATPVPHIGKDGKAQILLVGGDCLSGSDPKTGVELWRGYGINRKHGEAMRVVPSPVSAGEVAIACGPKNEQLIAFRTDLKGDITSSGLGWTYDEKKTPDVSTPAYYKGKLFVLDGNSKMLTCIDPKNGDKKWQGNLGDRADMRSSPTIADGKLYIINEKGTVFICGTGDTEFQLLKTIPMGDADGTRACIAISNKHLFIRTTQNLYCIGD